MWLLLLIVVVVVVVAAAAAAAAAAAVVVVAAAVVIISQSVVRVVYRQDDLIHKSVIKIMALPLLSVQHLQLMFVIIASMGKCAN